MRDPITSETEYEDTKAEAENVLEYIKAAKEVVAVTLEVIANNNNDISIDKFELSQTVECIKDMIGDMYLKHITKANEDLIACANYDHREYVSDNSTRRSI